MSPETRFQSSHSFLDRPSTGKITNTGTIDNTNGTIKNEGTIKSDPAKISGNPPTDNPVEPIDSKSDGSTSGGGGCNSGFGLFGLLPLGVWVARKRMTA
jgi:heat shock protein HslJ